jgi:hypothetical protein
LKPRAPSLKVSIGAFACSRLIAPKLTKPIPLGPNEVIFSSAIQRSTAPQLSSTMSFGP